MKDIPVKRSLIALCILFISLFCALRCQAQVSTAGAITGTVTDASGAVVPQVVIRIVNAETGVEISTQSNSDGTFVAPSVPVGTYSVIASKEGFQKYVESGIILHPATVATVNPVMQVGQVTTEVRVIASAAAVQTSTPEVSNLVSGQQVGTLPLNGRNFQSLTALMPGTVNTSAGSALLTGGRSFRPVMTINGLDGSRAFFLVDGISDTNMNQNTITPNPDTIEEVRALQSDYSTKYTFMGTSVIMVQTKSGTSTIHGSAFEYLRNDALNARNFFSATVPPLKQNIFGYTLGGPIFIPNHYNVGKAKTFFFWSQQWVVSHAGQTLLGATPTADMRNGLFPTAIKNPQTGLNYPTNGAGQYVLSGINSNSLAFMNALYPLPNNPAGGFNNYINNTPQITDQRDDEAKIDHNFTPRYRLTGEYLDERQSLITPALSVSGSVFPTNSETDITKNQLAQIQLVSTLSNSVVNTTSVSMNNFVLYLNVVGLQFVSDIPGFKETLPYNGFMSNRLPAVTFTGGWAGQGVNGGRPLTHASDLKDTLSDDISWVRGKHQIEGGVIVYKQTKRQGNNNAGLSIGSNGAFSFNGQYTGHPIADFLLGDAATFGQTSTVPRVYVHGTDASFYVSDRWKASRRLTLSLGLRLSFLPLPGPQPGFASVFEPALYNPAQAPVVNTNGTITPGANYNPLNGLVVNGLNGVPRNWFTGHQYYWAPMFGFAWDVFGNGKTSLRGGYGLVNTNRFTTEDCAFTCTADPPLVQSLTLVGPSFPSPVGSGTAAPLGAPTLYSEDPNFRAYQVQTYSLSLQHEFAGGWLATIAGAGTIARHLGNSTVWNMNQPLPNPPYDFNPNINTGTVFTYLYGPYQGYGAISTYGSRGNLYWNALELTLSHPMGHNLFLSAAYTWSHDLSIWGAELNNYNPNEYYGNVSGQNVPQILSGSVIWTIPWYRNATGIRGLIGGWKYSDITTIQNGPSFSPGLSVTHQGLGVRPNIVSSVQGPKTVAQWFNTAAFVAPAAGYFGNGGTGTILGPGLINFDMAFYKDFRIKERHNFEFRAELFNTFNHTNFNAISTALGAGTFGRVTSARDPRIAEFVLRYQF
jgi:hypothetical protein